MCHNCANHAFLKALVHKADIQLISTCLKVDSCILSSQEHQTS